jgi:hypothetical protein
VLIRRLNRRLSTTCLVVLSLLFSQWALASYVCPGPIDAESMAAMVMTADEPCEAMDQAQPVLCHQHCSAAAQSLEAVKLPVVPLAALVQVLQLPPVLDPAEPVAVLLAAKPEARPPPDPLFLTTLRLRV